jgi:hypothetical protein
MRKIHVFGADQQLPERCHPQPHRRPAHRGAAHRVVPRATGPRASEHKYRSRQHVIIARRDDPDVRFVRERTMRSNARRRAARRHRRRDRCHFRVSHTSHPFPNQHTQLTRAVTATYPCI